MLLFRVILVVPPTGLRNRTDLALETLARRRKVAMCSQSLKRMKIAVRGNPPSLVVGQPASSLPQLLPQNAVLFAKELDGELLALVEPAREDGNQDVNGVKIVRMGAERYPGSRCASARSRSVELLHSTR